MEIIIVICLLIVILLLLQDKIAARKRPKQKSKKDNENPNLPDIMGQPKPIRSLSLPSTINESQIEEIEINPDNLVIEYDDNEIIGIQIPQEEPDEVFSMASDYEEEEEEWNRYGMYSDDNGFAQGVTFEELSAVGMLLQEESFQPCQKETAVALVHKIHGTELFSLLENSIQGATKKIAVLLDSSFSSEGSFGSSIMRKSDLGDFDIKAYM